METDISFALQQIKCQPAGYAVLDLDLSYFCTAARGSKQTMQATEQLVKVFCGRQEDLRIIAGIILVDIFKANILPLTQDVSSQLTCSF